MKKAAQKTPRGPRRGAPPKDKGGPRPDPPPPSSFRPKDALLLLFPKPGYHPSLFREDLPGAVRQLRCKRGGLVVLKADREVVVFDREKEDHGGQSPIPRPKSFKLKKNARVDSLDCGVSQLLLLSSEGKLYEHPIASGRIKSEPRLLKQLGNKPIIQVTCGDYHSMALSKGGELFAWGENEYGQLGMGRKSGFFEDPQLVRALEGIPLAMIAAGSAHSLALSGSGAVYSWGKNSSGQLGLGDTKDRYCPIYVKALKHMKTTAVSCGGEHTALLSKDGLVCTFGAGSHGQLGHNSTRNELLPRIVAELFGAQVSQVACGRWHTLVYVPALGEVFSFGLGVEGQLGNGKNSDQLIPLPLDLTMNGQKIILGGSSKEVVKIIAGESQSIVLLLNEKNSYADLNRTLAKVEEGKVEKWLSNSDPKCWKNIQQEITLIFSSAACINGSFLDKRGKHFTTSWKTAGVDLSAVFLFYEKIAAKSKVLTQVINGLKKLLNSLHPPPASPEALRVFLVVPILLRKQDIKSDGLLNQLARSICLLSQQAKGILECFWSNIEVTFFKDLVSLYQKLVSVKLSAFIDLQRISDNAMSTGELMWSIQVLQMLYEVNRKTGFRIQESNFYIPEVKRILKSPNISHIRHEQVIRRIFSRVNELKMALQTLLRFPFMFDLEDKITMHGLSCIFQNPMAHLGLNNVLRVRRQYLMQDTWQCIRSARTNQFQQFLTVHFEGEPGIDDGGLSQEFFTILGRELCAPEAQIFRHFEESHLIWFSHQLPAQDEDIYYLIGYLCGMAMYSAKIAAFPFPLALFKKMANVPLTLEDFKELFPIEGRSLQAILDKPYEDAFEHLMLDFTLSEERGGAVVELKENGANIPVTKYNRKEYVDAYIDHVFTVSVKEQFEDFMCGFERGCPVDTWKMFLPAELRVVLLGHRKYDWEQLEKNAKYSGYEKSDETIKDFWAVFHDLDEERKKKFLAFLTGTDCIPAQGMEKFTFTIADTKKTDPDEWYPVACTCLKVFLLPRYTNRDVLKKRLLCALEWFEKFGLP